MTNLKTHLTIVLFSILVLGVFGNVGIGYAQTGNTLTGTDVGVSLTTGSYNVFTGYQAGTSTTTGYSNVFTGYKAGDSNTTGNYNLFNGYRAGNSNTTGGNNIFSGREAGYSNITGNYNVFDGYRAGYSNTTGNYNLFNGYLAGYSNTIGQDNVFIGHKAGFSNTTGNYNLFNGHLAGNSNTTGSNNIFIGYRAGYSANVNSSVFLGQEAGINETNDARLHIGNGTVNTTSLIYGEFDDGQLGINTDTIPDGYTLAINGKVIATELKVLPYIAWPDYVFSQDYKLKPLEEVAAYIQTEKHLPGVPSAQEIAEADGFEVGKMTQILLEKVEELTLYMIDLEEKNRALEQRMKEMEQQ